MNASHCCARMHEEARSIFHHALRSSSIAAAFDRRFPSAFPFAEYDRIYAVALGKAALPMLEALRARLPRALAGGVCCGPVLPSGPEAWSGVLHRRPSFAQSGLLRLRPCCAAAVARRWASGISSFS